MKLKPDDFIFLKTPQKMNQYLKNLGYNILGIGTKEKIKYGKRQYDVIKKGITLYDFRHSSACYWLPRYQSESALKYRFGWKKSDMIYYYTELLGMKDTIEQDDLYIDVTKTELERDIKDKGNKIELLQEQMTNQNNKLEEQNKKYQEVMNILKAIQLEKMIESQTG